jgi:hypothetical protein
MLYCNDFFYSFEVMIGEWTVVHFQAISEMVVAIFFSHFDLYLSV